jgi:hypothetical protein
MSAHPSFPTRARVAPVILRSFLVAGTICTIAVPVAAEDCTLGYPAFEFAVPHVDLETCPAAMAAEDVFCGASIASDALHVFAFAEDGEQCLVALQSFDEDAFTIDLR